MEIGAKVQIPNKIWSEVPANAIGIIIDKFENGVMTYAVQFADVPDHYYFQRSDLQSRIDGEITKLGFVVTHSERYYIDPRMEGIF